MIKALSIVLGMAMPFAAFADTYLLMAEEPGCYWCAKWNDEIAPIYPKTAEGRTVPLRRYDLRSGSPDVLLSRGVHFTPTFILVEDGSEVSRIEGYPGEDFFWGMLGMMLDSAGIPWRHAQAGAEDS